MELTPQLNNRERRVSISMDETTQTQTMPNSGYPNVGNAADKQIIGNYKRGPISKSNTPAIQIRNACKSYQPGKLTLDNLEMNVPRGTIYGLLGSSGCGKTTLLSSIIGLQELDSGDIFVFGRKPGTKGSGIPGRRLGYMPQDIALYDYLTIKEILEYFGRIYGMSASEINGQTEFLVNFLQLPSKNKTVCTLSGGQKRRCSLAASLIHDPELLLLDEPTVGLDPLLRESIWNHLHQLVTTHRTTVILTTHYIEEARNSHTVGLMRNGRLLVEKAPALLLQEHNATLLEDIVLKLCRNDLSPSIEDSVKNNNHYGNANKDADLVREALSEISFYSRVNKMLGKGKHQTEYKEMGVESPAVVGLKFQRRVSMADFETQRKRRLSLKRSYSFVDTMSDSVWFQASRIKALTIRNYLNFFRNPIFVLGIVFLPALQMMLSTLVIGQDPRFMKMGVANHEFGGGSNWTEICDSSNGSVCGADLSCRYLDKLKHDNEEFFDLEYVGSEEEAVRKVQQGKLWGYVSFPANYSTYIGYRGSHGKFAEDDVLDGSIIRVQLDMSHYLAGVFIIQNLFTSFQRYMRETILTCGGTLAEIELPFRYETPVYGTLDAKFMEYIIPGALVMIIFSISLCSCAVSVINDRKQGTLDRSIVAGIRTFDTIVSYFITEGTTIIFQSVVGSVILINGFNLEIQGSIALFLFVCIITGLCGQASGLLVGTLVADEVEALFLGSFFYLPMMMLAGVMWPLQAMPYWLQYFAYSLPLTLISQSLRSIVSRGVGIMHPTVWPGIAMIVLWTVVIWIVALITFRSLKKK